MREWLREIRELKGKTQGNVADFCGVTREFICQIETGNRGVKPSLAKKIAEFLDFEWTIFYANEGNETIPEQEQMEEVS